MSGRDANQLERELARAEARKAELWDRVFRAEDTLERIYLEWHLNDDVPASRLADMARAYVRGEVDA